MRAFIAIEMPEEIKEILLDAQKQIDTEKAKIRPAKAFHLTLKFLGEVDETKIEEIKQKLKEIKIKKETFQITEFKLIKSTLTGEGPVYEDLASFS